MKNESIHFTSWPQRSSVGLLLLLLLNNRHVCCWIIIKHYHFGIQPVQNFAPSSSSSSSSSSCFSQLKMRPEISTRISSRWKWSYSSESWRKRAAASDGDVDFKTLCIMEHDEKPRIHGYWEHNNVIINMKKLHLLIVFQFRGKMVVLLYYATSCYSTLLDANRRYPTLPDAILTAS
jgi:hypothetical protein